MLKTSRSIVSCEKLAYHHFNYAIRNDIGLIPETKSRKYFILHYFIIRIAIELVFFHIQNEIEMSFFIIFHPPFSYCITIFSPELQFCFKQ